MAIAVTNKETMQMELSSKVRDLCQVCNWARTVTLPLSFTWQTSVSLRLLVDIVLWLWFPWILLMEVVNSVLGVVKMLNRFLSGIFNWPSSSFNQVLELLSRCC